MEFFTTFTKNEIQDAADKPLQVTHDLLENIQGHLCNIKRRILIDDNTLLSIVSAINTGFNVILYGPPGTAKSTLSSFLPVEFYGAKCNIHTADSDWNVRRVIGGITVTYDNSTGGAIEKIGPKDGYIVDDIFECYESRLLTTDYDTVFTVIDEFNRTNMDECLGPMFTAMGSDNRTLKLDYNKGFNDDLLEIPVPKGYRMICNLNKYDRTFTNELSEALSRRFKWIYIGAPSKEKYEEEENLVEENVFGNIASIKPNPPVNLTDVPAFADSNLFKNCIIEQIYDLINDLRNDLEVGTSYKIDSVKIANQFFVLKLSMIDWRKYSSIKDINEILDCDSVDDVAARTIDRELLDLIKSAIQDTIDAALVMTVVPACESLEDTDAIERNKNRFREYVRCTEELKRMRVIF